MEELIQKRKKHKITQATLAKAMSCGVNTVQNIEYGHVKKNKDKLKKLYAYALDDLIKNP